MFDNTPIGDIAIKNSNSSIISEVHQKAVNPAALFIDELADLAINSESDSLRDEGSSGMRSEGEDDMERKIPPQNGRKPGQLGSTPNHLSLSTTSTLSSSSTTSQARLVQSSLRETNGPPVPPPRSTSSGESAANQAQISCSADLGKNSSSSKTTCMQCYLSGHSDGSLDSVDPSTEGSSSAETGTPSTGGPFRDRDSGIMEDKFDRFEQAGSDQKIKNNEDRQTTLN